ncbi:carbohydrate ABC transporter permease [Alicyclobacillus fastidiosus]|uniref:Carbohydrate ABC transporter permease n=1 Tax=Alicyclobacillus fastidiosus TaxID=392011 RepID=A0ABV5ACY3_9BACL|nr:carbohydrate ABC transporter permease [Alicyclobacillus fastidiosus]WEH10524.1 carbohydrate ABC transporter permease [Alicyclobacillus fastidiosus]
MSTRSRALGQGGYLALAIVCVAILIFPLYWTIVSSLKTQLQLFASHPSLIPTTPQWGIYASVFAQQWTHLVTSLIIAFGSLLLSLLIAVPAAYALAQFRSKAVPVFLLVLLIVQMIPGISLANALFIIFHKVGLLNNYLGLMLADTTYAVPFCALILRAFMMSIPKELIEAAMVDGTGDFGAFIRVVLPITKPALVTASLFSFLFTWSDFLFAITMTTSDKIQPVTLAIYQYIGNYGSNWNQLMAFAVIASVPAAVFLIFSQRYITAGISSTGLKG